jgi:hypothetical protein
MATKPRVHFVVVRIERNKRISLPAIIRISYKSGRFRNLSD